LHFCGNADECPTVNATSEDEGIDSAPNTYERDYTVEKAERQVKTLAIFIARQYC